MRMSSLITETLNRLRIFRWQIVFAFLFTSGSALAGVVTPILTGRIIDGVLQHANIKLIFGLAIGIFISMICQELFGQLRLYLLSIVALRFTRQLRIDVFRSLLHTRFQFFNVTPKGDILQRSLDDTQAFQSFSLVTVPQFAQELILAILSFIAIISIYWPLGAIGVIIYTLYLLPVKYFGNVQRAASMDLTILNSNLKQIILEKLESLRLIKTFGNEEKEYEQVSREQEKWLLLVRRRYVTDNFFRNLPRILDALAPALVFAIGGWKVFSGDLTVGNLVTITGFLPAVNAPIRSFSSTFLSFKDIGSRLERVYEFLNLQIEPGRLPNLKKLNHINGEIKFENVSYQTNSRDVLMNVSFTIKTGEFIALVGPSGSGKSTVIKLLSRMIEPTSGSIKLDGHALQELDAQALRQHMGIVTQDTFLFNDSILNNLCYESHASFEEIKETMSLIGLGKFLEQVSNGYNFMVGEKGDNLSGGQRQRIGIARTLLRRADILLLDEVTSALDNENEAMVMSAIKELKKDRTCLFIAHRLETIKNADRILVFDKGLLVEEGTHEYLISKKGLYFRLWNASLMDPMEEGEKITHETIH